MITLLELHYNIQKDLFFAEKIVLDSYTIYHSKNLDHIYCNYAVISELTSAGKIFQNISAAFAQLERKPCIYINANQINDLRELQDQKAQVRYIESWLRYDGDELECFHPAKIVSPADYDNYLQLFSSIDNNSEYKIMPQYIEAVKASLSSPRYHHFIAYDGKKPVSIASIGSYNGYSMIYNLFTHPNYRGKGYTQSVIGSCINKFKEINGKEIYILLPSNSHMEKWYVKNGFKKIYTGYRMSL